jgi:hypothetical protein
VNFKHKSSRSPAVLPDIDHSAQRNFKSLSFRPKLADAFSFAFASCERVGSRSGGTLA